MKEKEPTFISGVDLGGAVAQNTYATYNTEATNFDPPRAYISKWYSDSKGSPIASTSKVGTADGVVTYAFGSEVRVETKTAYEASLTLWSDMANLQFKKIATPSSASIRINNMPEDNGDTFNPANGYRVPGSGATDLPTHMAPNARGGQVTIDIYSEDSDFNSFNGSRSNLMGPVTHETGHALGLAHAGRYNGSLDYAGQSTAHDNRAYSVMSYVSPDDSNARYFRADQNFQWSSGASSSGYGSEAQTPMILDIQATQQLYGTSTSATFSGGQTYGYNSNLADTSKVFYDFNTNKQQVVTLYNEGTNKTLDVSGFGTGSNSNRNPGTFSSASATGQLINNIAIAYDTQINRAIGGAGDDAFTLNANGDTIDGGGNTARIWGASADYTVTKTGASSAIVVDKATGVTDSLTNIQNIQFAPPVCFTSGTLIRTRQDGIATDLPVEDLEVGDRMLTASEAMRSITWIGDRHLGTASPLPVDQAPVRIRAGAFGTGLPARDLRLSPGHPVLVGADAGGDGGVLVPVMCLINGTTIAREPAAQVTYWHVELDAHDILLAEGLPAESYIDLGSRPWFGGADGALFDPHFLAPAMTGRCRPVAVDGPLVVAEPARLGAVFASDLLAHCASRW